jgi:uncharacterized protein YsxB (DUF464 family)
MIEVKLFYKKDQLNEILVLGHSGSADRGEDVVCAAVSVLTITILNGMTEIVGLSDMEYHINEGVTQMFIPQDLKGETKVRVDTLIDTFILGLKGIEEVHSEYIEIYEM